MITITDAAVVVLRKLLDEESGGQEDAREALGLRLGVDRGGCAGLQYAMRIGPVLEDDYVHQEQGVRILIDRDSIPFVKGSTVDYSESLSDSGFRITNPNAARSCGCGTSFEPAAEEDGSPDGDGKAEEKKIIEDDLSKSGEKSVKS
jgi:iron-sulfur cluster assembly protein